MAEVKPSKDDIEAIFRKLRAISTNKVCFDCSAKNPTWATVTYGVFICIDCSAVHRSLGVHLTFVRSTQLDTNWTWLQLRQMQLGGNAAASVFFRQHNCVTADAQQKYTSRAAQLYKDKLSQMAASVMRSHGTELHLEASHDKVEEPKKEVDFFDEHSSFPEFQADFSVEPKAAEVAVPNTPAVTLSGKGPSVDTTAPLPTTGERKSLIGGRKPAAKKTGLGAKKAGLGAQRVQTNFADIEKEAEMIDQRKEKQEEKIVVTQEEEQEQIMSMRLAYKDLSIEQHKQEERLKKSDPKKAQQVERLGMGYSAKSNFSHSALSDMQTISQESPVKTASKPSYDLDDIDEFFDDFSFSRPLKFQDAPKEDYIRGGEDGLPSSNYQKMFNTREEKSSSSSMSSSKSWYGSSQAERSRAEPVPSHLLASSDDAQKKFGNAKAISSDQFFGQSDDNSYERKANLSRFEGSTSISSSDYFQDGRSAGSGSRGNYGSGITSSISAPDLDDVKESVRQGVTKVAGRISSLANGVINSIQDRYGY